MGWCGGCRIGIVGLDIHTHTRPPPLLHQHIYTHDSSSSTQEGRGVMEGERIAAMSSDEEDGGGGGVQMDGE